ncbi:MAG TPA: hypothetical protein VK576_05890 [Thermoleophilia bacterium]|nr:hypothetical protein [Thermoleophilia bacterium]
MSDECELLAGCGFFRKYQATRDAACKGFIAQYCRGPKMDGCQRKVYRAEHGMAPSDDMLPSGLMVVED